MLLPAYVAKYAALQPGEQHASETVAIAGDGSADVSAMTVLVARAQEALKLQRNYGAALPVYDAKVQVFCPPQGIHTLTYQCCRYSLDARMGRMLF